MEKKILALFLVSISGQVLADDARKCPPAYGHCNLGLDGYINVHIVPHTHDDVGWLKTVDQYYYGSNLNQQDARVQYILDSVVEELAKDPAKRFVYVEIAYFWRWWNEQTDATKQLVRNLVYEGQLEFVIAGWCMNDEATTYYNDIIDQQSLGLKFILKEFGSCARPRSAWQIDPFGHSREQASLFAQFGFDGLFLGRVDYQDKDYRTLYKTREMLWQASANLDGDTAQLFTGILHNGYNPPDGFCFDQYCNDEPIMDDPNLDEYNVNKKVASFIEQTLDQAKAYKTSNLIMTMGSDFQYSNAHLYFKNLDKAIYHVNKQQQQNGSQVNIFYSTTACYLNALHNANTSWPVKSDDFFPYAHRGHSFWTGYFTSRPALKDMVRRASNFLQAVRQLAAFTDLSDDASVNALGVLERAMGIAQHHDAVSGTERQHVANDYAKRLAHGMQLCIDVVNKALASAFLNSNSSPRDQIDFRACPLLNISECNVIENQPVFYTFVFNPLPRDISSWIRVPVVGTNYQVNDGEQILPSDFTAVSKQTQKIPERNSSADNVLIFKGDLPTLGFKLYLIEPKNGNTRGARLSNLVRSSKRAKRRSPFVIENENLLLEFDAQGNLAMLRNKAANNLETAVQQYFCVYKSMAGNNSEENFQASGAYIFRPQTQDCEKVLVTSYQVTVNSLLSEIHQVYNDWISQTIRLYKDAQNAEFEWQVGSIPIDDSTGREIVIKFDSDIKSNSLFYTDSNGRETLQRKRNFRPTWPLNNTEPVSGNYYPINSRIFIRDDDASSGRQLTLVTDRSQGGSSVQDGSLEIMVHRRTLFDDSLGVTEPINEPGQDGEGLVVKGVVSLVFATSDNSAKVHRELAHRINSQPLIMFTGSFSQRAARSLENLRGWQAVKVSLPLNIHLLTLMKDFDERDEALNSIIVRLEHFYEKNEDKLLSEPVSVDLLDVFGKTFNITSVEELALGANMPVNELKDRLKWKADSTDSLAKEPTIHIDMKKVKYSFTFLFNPMQIRTFRIWYLPRTHEKRI